MVPRFGKVAEKKPALHEETAKIAISFGASEASGPGGGLLLELAGAGDIKNTRTRVEVEHHTARNWGGRHENEDRVMNHKDLLLDTGIGFTQVGVLDGHDTEVASDMVSQRLPGEFSKRLKEGQSVVDAYTKSMESLEDQLKSFTSSAGTCVLSCTIAGRFLWCANLGDCRSILVPLAVPDPPGPPGPAVVKPKVQGIVWMSEDKKASMPNEKARITQAGGHVIDGRVEGLEPSRTLGDFDVKAQVKKGVISIIPEVRRHEFSNEKGVCQAVLVCATDGVWDVLNSQDICNLIVARKEICKLQTTLATLTAESECAAEVRNVLKLLAEDLVQFSIAKGSRDDCTAIVSLISVPAADSDSRSSC